MNPGRRLARMAALCGALAMGLPHGAAAGPLEWISVCGAHGPEMRLLPRPDGPAEKEKPAGCHAGCTMPRKRPGPA